MTKSPRVGLVKTRLAAEIGEIHAAGLYRCFLLDIIETLSTTGYSIIIYYTPEDAFNELQELFGKDFQYISQVGADLGERLYSGMERAKQLGFSYAIAVASDVPEIKREYLNESITALKKHSVVIGPSLDGGYNLIGLKLDYNNKKFFSQIDWGTNEVYNQTMNKLNRLNVYTLPSFKDIDTLSDLETLKVKESSHTNKYITEKM